MFVANVSQSGDQATFGIPRITLSDNRNIRIDSNALKIALELLPAVQPGLREIATRLDP